jgi:hypothetical protein
MARRGEALAADPCSADRSGSVLDSVLTGSDGPVSASQLWRSRVVRLGWVLASGPAALLAILLLHALHVRTYLGRWPVVYRDQP